MNSAAEVDKIVARYDRRKAQGRDQCAQLLLPNRYLSHQEKERAFLTALQRKWKREEIPDLRVLEVGCGYGDNLLQFIRWGCDPENLIGNELLEDRCAQARERLPQRVQVLQGDAAALDLPAESFDIVLQSTVFTSILDDDFQRALAKHMWSLTAPGGAVLWYDFAFNNPKNPDVRGVRRGRIRELFPHGEHRCQRITLAPPLARMLTRLSPALYTVANAVPLLRTHLFCVIEKGRITAPAEVQRAAA